MKYYIGCDVSMKAISVCVLDKEGKVVQQADIGASPCTLIKLIRQYGSEVEVGLEAGSTSSWLYHGLKASGVSVVCMEVHDVQKKLSSKRVKNDRNDAEGIAQLLRIGWYKSVHVKASGTQKIKSLVSARECVKRKVTDIKNTIRGLVKPFGFANLPQGKGSAWVDAVNKRLSADEEVKALVGPLLELYIQSCEVLAKYDKQLKRYARTNEVCKRLMSIPGIGEVNAVAFTSIVEDAHRFKKNRDIGSYLGLTPRIYASGEMEKRGRITRAGSSLMRSLLFEAAQALLRRSKKMSSLKSWAMRLCKRKPSKVVITALARKLAIIMLAVWKKGTTFQMTKADIAALAGV